MTDKFYKAAFDAAVKELALLKKEHDELIQREEALEKRMDKVRSAALGLASIAEFDFEKIQDEYPELFTGQTDPRIGITEAVQQALREANESLTPTEIRDRVFSISPSVAGHKNPLASIHAVLRRLIDTDRVIIITYTKTGKTGYLWVDRDDFEEVLRKRFPDIEEHIIKRIKASRKKRG